MDEKWSFVGKKQARCDPQDRGDDHQGDCWDFVALDPEHRLVLAVVCGKRHNTLARRLLQRVYDQLQGRVPRLISSDDYPAYRRCIHLTWSRLVQPRRKGKYRPRSAYRRRLPHLNYATVCKRREHGRVVEVKPRVIFGTAQSIRQALRLSGCSSAVNTSFLEREHATDRLHNARKRRRTYCFSKDWRVHQWVGSFTLYSYNFCWCVRTLRRRRAPGRWRPRTPAMAAGLTDHVWSLQEWLSYPIAGLSG